MMASKKNQVVTLFQFGFVSNTWNKTESSLCIIFPNEALTAEDYGQLQERRCKAILSPVMFHQKEYLVSI